MQFAETQEEESWHCSDHYYGQRFTPVKSATRSGKRSKFSLEDPTDRITLLTAVHNIARKAPEQEMACCISEDVDALQRTYSSKKGGHPILRETTWHLFPELQFVTPLFRQRGRLYS